MHTSKMMAEFPPVDEAQVTLANWRKQPFSEWGFRNVRELLPTANVARSSASTPLPYDLKYLDNIAFEGVDGNAVTLPAALALLKADGLMVLHRGKVVHERYDHGLSPSAQHIVFSVSKSFLGSLAGILTEAGKLHPDDAVVKHLPEMKGTAYAESTIRHLLDMNVGISFDEDYLKPDGDIAKYRFATGWDVSEAGGLPSPHLREYLQTMKADGSPHGQTFHYVSTNTDVLGWLFERVCGMAYAKILHHYIWEPMGAEDDAYITVDSRGAARAAGGFCATVRDLARFGEVMRNNGVSATGRQVVPASWIDDIRNNGDAGAWARGKFTEMFPNGNYRSKWYIPDAASGAFCAIGIHGQYIYVDPTDEAVIVRVSSQHIPHEIPNDRMWVRACHAITGHLAGR